jgi:hypothetical protein
MYALDIYSNSVGDLIRTEFFDTIDGARAAAESLDADDVRMVIVETTGEPDDEGEVAADY